MKKALFLGPFWPVLACIGLLLLWGFQQAIHIHAEYSALVGLGLVIAGYLPPLWRSLLVREWRPLLVPTTS